MLKPLYAYEGTTIVIFARRRMNPNVEELMNKRTIRQLNEPILGAGTILVSADFHT